MLLHKIPGDKKKTSDCSILNREISVVFKPMRYLYG